jgi:hypothetical protein
MKPWKKKVQLGDVFRNEDMTFEARRDAIVERLKKLSYYHSDEEFRGLVDELAEAVDHEDFDWVWEDIYNWSDRDKRLWIETVTIGDWIERVSIEEKSS